MPGYGQGFGATARAAVPVVPAPFSAVAANGWQTTVAAPTDLSLSPAIIARPGYDASGAAVQHAETLYLTKRVRQAYPAHASLTADQVALNDYIYATDLVPGASNGSGETSPKPVAAWVMPSRLLAGDSLHWEMLAFHRDARGGQQVACVRVRANNGTAQTAWQTVATTAVSTLCEDRAAVAVYQGDLDVSGLSDGLIWLEAEVYPWIGGGASVRTTADYSGPGEFSPRYYLKESARAAAPPLAYVSTGGNDGTGVWSTTAATAKASPFATWVGAFNAIYAAGFAGVTGGKADGCRIRLMAGTHVLTGPTSTLKRRLDCAALVIERDPDSPRADCIASFGSTAWSPNSGVKADGSAVSLLSPLSETATLFHDVALLRTGSAGIGPTASGTVTCHHFVQFWNVVMDDGAQSATWLGANTHDMVFGMEVTNGSPSLANGASQRRRGWRGMKMDCNNGAIEGYLVTGCEMSRPGATGPSATSHGLFAYANRMLRAATTVFTMGSSTGTVDRCVVAQNLVEYTGTASALGGRISADNESVSLVHPIVIHNSGTGIGAYGRWNLLYDETIGTLRTHKLQRVAGNIFPQLNHKGDEFRSDGAHVGGFAFEHGVGCSGNYTVHHDAGGTSGADSFRQFYPGIGSRIAQGSPLYVDYQGTGGTTSSPVAGAGGGDYHLQSGSAARDMVATRMLAFDLGGAVRGSGVQAAGAYA